MASLNKTQLIGHLGRDPDVRALGDGTAVAAINLATTETWKDKATGEKKEATEWHRVVLFGKTAEIAADYLKKGSLVYFEGRNATRKYTDKDGVERSITEVKCDTMQMLDRAPAQIGGSRQRNQPAPATRPAPQTGGFNGMDDEIPFAPLAAGKAWSSI